MRARRQAVVVASIVALIALPRVASSTVIDGPIVNPANGHTYYLLAPELWTEADAEAVSLGGHLVAINDQAEEDWVFGTFGYQNGVPNALWIGLMSTVGPTGPFGWTDGESVNYSHWDVGEPSNFANEVYVEIYCPTGSHPGLWNNIANDEAGQFCTTTLPWGVVEVGSSCPNACDDGDNCTADSCNPITGCLHTATPKALGDDDQGCVPPDKSPAKCEDGIAKDAAKLSLALFKCHLKASAAGLKVQPFDEEGCETAALGKYTLKIGLLQACPACLNTGAVRDGVTNQVDGMAGATIYCDSESGALLADGDDGGWVPADKTTAKCEDGATKALAKLVGAVVKCHTKLADAKVKAQPFDEEGCETAAVGKFDAARLKLTGCPACLAPLLPGLGVATAGGLDGQNAQIYCASPSGAFIE